MANPIENIAAKAMGTAKAVKAGFKGLRGVFLHLAQEHGEVGELMRHVPHIRAELLSHEKGELSEVYPVLANYEAMRSVVLKHNAEAHDLEKAISVVDVLPFESDEWAPAFERLFALVQTHVEEEENDFFPRAQEVINEDESKVLLKRYEQAKAAVKQHVQ